MAFRKLSAAAAAASLMFSGAAMASSPVRASDSVAVSKAVAPIGHSVRGSADAQGEQLAGGGSIIIIILAAAAVIAGIVVVANGGNGNSN